MKKNVYIITSLSFFACVLHTVVLLTGFGNYLFTSVLKIILFSLCPVIYSAVTKENAFKLMFRRGDKKNLRICVLLGFGVFAFILLAYVLLSGYIDRAMIIDAMASNGITSDNFPLVFIYIVLINAALEEIFFRGFVFIPLYNGNHKRYAYGYSAFLFSFYHVAIIRGALSAGMLIFCIVGLLIAGMIFNELTIRCKNIIGALIVHLGANLALNLIVVYYYSTN